MRVGVILGLIILCLVTAGVVLGLPALAAANYGPPAPRLTYLQAVQYSARLLWADGLLLKVADRDAPDLTFEVKTGESVTSVCERLQTSGIVLDGGIMRDYLVYTGMDTTLQAGEYTLSGALSIIDVAARLQDATPTEVDFVVLPGWRMEEIASTLPTSGLAFSPEEFIRVAAAPHGGYDFLAGAGTTEGFLHPGSYVLPRTAAATDLVETLLRGFANHLTSELRAGFEGQGLTVQQAVIVASIVEREAVREDEAPVVASVFLNRLRAGMRLDADPTVQYAIGFNAAQGTWWTNPLSLDDLKVQSPYNTYTRTGLPPAPISNPGRVALQAVAEPASTQFHYFSARCDVSGYHVFAGNFEEHLANLCR